MKGPEWRSWAHKLVEDVASLHLTPDETPKYFEEDILLFTVWRLETEDADWLLGLLRDRSYPTEGRVRIANYMSTLRQRAFQSLGVEDPNLEAE